MLTRITLDFTAPEESTVALFSHNNLSRVVAAATTQDITVVRAVYVHATLTSACAWQSVQTATLAVVRRVFQIHEFTLSRFGGGWRVCHDAKVVGFVGATHSLGAHLFCATVLVHEVRSNMAEGVE